MTKKDYARIAQALKDNKPEFSAGLRDILIQSWNNTVETIAMTLQQDNPRFDRNHFLTACGYDN